MDWTVGWNTESLKCKLEECMSTKWFKMKEDILEKKRTITFVILGGNIIYSKIHIIVKIDGKESGK